MALLIGALVGLVIGWVLGGWTACSDGPGCEVRADIVTAVGTWVGGLGTFGTLLYGVVKFRGDSAEQRRAVILDSRRSAIRFVPKGADSYGKYYRKVHITVTNQTAVDMTDVQIVLDRGTDKERVLMHSLQVHSGRDFGTSATVEELGLPDLPLEPEITAGAIINEKLEPRVSLLFQVHGESFVRTGTVVSSA